jgi:uncharacterized protein (TIGR03435 family)
MLSRRAPSDLASTGGRRSASKALRVHRETQTRPTYDLVAVNADHRLGQRAQIASTDCTPYLSGQRPLSDSPAIQTPAGTSVPRCLPNVSVNPLTGVVSADLHGVTLMRLADLLQRHSDRPIVDKTDINGVFDISLTFSDDTLPRIPGVERNTDVPSLFTALVEDLGLRLRPSRGPVTILMIDSAQPPTED